MLAQLIQDSLGYYFAPTEHFGAPGSAALEVTLRVTPTNRHFDPETIQVPIYLPEKRITTLLRIQHPWTGAQTTHRICPGRIYVHDRKQKRIEAFTLGGSVQIESEAEATHCIVHSPAPIFDLLLPDTLPPIMTEEIEVLLAGRRAQWADEKSFEEHLAQADPLQLYVACLKTLSDKFADYELLEEDPLRPLMNFLHSEYCTGPEGLISRFKVVHGLDEVL